MKNKVYVGMVADGIHPGHINIIKEASKLGYVIIGLLTDRAVKKYKRKTILNYKQRRFILKNIKGIDKIVKQKTLDYTENIRNYKPDILLHGDDWKNKNSPQYKIRKKVIQEMEKINGKVIDIPYTKGISTTTYIEKIKNE